MPARAAPVRGRCRTRFAADIFAKMRVAEPVYAAVRALLWVNQAVGLVGKLIKFNDLAQLLTTAKSVPITDRCSTVRHTQVWRREVGLPVACALTLWVLA
jgi:hypothetical protein